MEKPNARHCYAVLGLKPGATLAQIRERRGQLAQQWHPDKETDPQRKAHLEDKMKDINNAFDFLRTFLSGAPAGPSPAPPGPQANPPPPPPAQKPWEAEAEERRRKTAEREASERREQAARKREWKAEFQRVQAEAARRHAQQQADAARLQAWLAQEKARQEQEGAPRNRRNGPSFTRPEADAVPPVRQEAVTLSRQREPRPPARTETGKSKHIYLSGKCTKCGRSKEQIAHYALECV